MVMYNDDEKGEAISICGGKYCGLNGWIWLGQNKPLKQKYVILQTKDGKEKGVRVNKGNVEARRGDPTSLVDAVLQQHSDISRDMNKLCKKLAKCRLTGNEDELYEVIYGKIDAAYNQQLAEGPKAVWYDVDYVQL